MRRQTNKVKNPPSGEWKGGRRVNWIDMIEAFFGVLKVFWNAIVAMVAEGIDLIISLFTL